MIRCCQQIALGNLALQTDANMFACSGGDEVVLYDGRPNGELMMATGCVQAKNPADYLTIEVVGDRMLHAKPTASSPVRVRCVHESSMVALIYSKTTHAESSLRTCICHHIPACSNAGFTCGSGPAVAEQARDPGQRGV
jgi:hypothetical protein